MHLFRRYALQLGKRSRSNRFSSTDKINETIPHVRGEQAKGAMKDFLKMKPEGDKETGIWSKLIEENSNDRNNSTRERVQPPEKTEKSRNIREVSKGKGGKRSSLDDGFNAGAPFKKRENKDEDEDNDGDDDNDNEAQDSRGKRNYGSSSRSRSSKEDDYSDKDIPPEIQSQLLDHEYLRDQIKLGKVFNDKDFDPIDKYFANVFLEALKNDRGEHIDVMESKTKRRVRLPQKRSMSQLVQSTQPNFFPSHLNPHSLELGKNAWTAISNNIYFSDVDKRYICSEIAKQSHAIFVEADRIMVEYENRPRDRVIGEGEIDEYEIPFDLVFQPGFRKGYEGLEEERMKEALETGEEYVPTEYGNDNTNWEVEAVEDEDDLEQK